MEVFSFVENSFDINLINKCKSHLGSKSIKNINVYLRSLCEPDTLSNNSQIINNNEKNKEKIQQMSEENKDSNKIFNDCIKESKDDEKNLFD